MRPASMKTFYFQSDAHSLGGSIQHPTAKMIPSQAHSSLPAVGGHVTTTTGEFNHDSIVSCRAAYTRVSGREHQTDGPWSMVVTSVIEDLNILEVITAKRIVAQMSIEYSQASGHYPTVSFAGTHFEGVRLGNHDLTLTMNPTLLNLKHNGDGSLSHKHFEQVGREQGKKIVKSAAGERSKWVRDRFGWMDSHQKSGEDRCVLCSVVDGVNHEIPGNPYGHVVEIPNFGRVFFGELLSCHGSTRLSMIRAELGCHVNGNVSASVVGGGGVMFPP
jgi:hypothetical protein